MENAALDRVPEGRHDEWQQLSLGGRAALALSSVFVAVGLFTVGGVLPAMAGDFASVPHAALLIQLIGSAAAPAFALASPLAGRLVGRFGVKALYGWSLALFLVAGIAPAAASSPHVVLVLRVVLGCAVAGAFTAGMTGISRLPERQRHQMFGIAAFLGGAVAIAAYQIVGSLAVQSWRAAFYVHLLLLPAAVLCAFLPGGRGITAPAETPPSSAGLLAGVPAALVVAATIVGWAMVASSVYSPFYLVSIGIAAPQRIGSILAVMAFCSLIGSGAYGALQSRFGTAKLMKTGMGVAAGGGVVLLTGGDMTTAMLGLGLMGVGLGLCGTAVYGLAVEMAPDINGGAVTGLVSLAIYLPQVIFPTIAASIAAAFGAQVVYGLVAALLALGMAVLGLRTAPR